MSQTRILCERCGFPQIWCTCGGVHLPPPTTPYPHPTPPPPADAGTGTPDRQFSSDPHDHGMVPDKVDPFKFNSWRLRTNAEWVEVAEAVRHQAEADRATISGLMAERETLVEKSHGLNLLRLRHGIEIESDPVKTDETDTIKIIVEHWRAENCSAARGTLIKYCSTHQDLNAQWATHMVKAANREKEEAHEALNAFIEHHELTDQIIRDAQGQRPETGKALLFVMDNLKTDIAVLRAQLASADKDRERLDWLIADACIVEPTNHPSAKLHVFTGLRHNGRKLGRDAIDAAMQPSASLDHGAREEKGGNHA